MAGVRALAIVGDELHLDIDNADSRDKQSVLVKDYLGGQTTVTNHFRCTLPSGQHSGFLKGEFVREFPTLLRVEGIVITDGGASSTSPTRTRVYSCSSCAS